MADQRIRVQPRGLCIPEEAPFRHDRLERKKSAEVLTRIVSRIEGPCVVALDAPWGYGKTTFLNMWAQWLRNEGFPVVAFNAWETDFTDQPFLALSSELMKELESFTKTAPDLCSIVNTVKGAIPKVLWAVGPKLAGTLIPGVGGVVEAAITALPAALSGAPDPNDYQEAKTALANFKEALGALTCKLAKNQSDRSLIIMIDELDRCRPSYAVELLEVAKHFFAVDNVVFVLAVNRAQLAHAVKALYGLCFDAEGYLRRFFDLDFQLPKPSREQFVQDLLKTTNLTSILATSDPDDLPAVEALLEAFLGSPELSLRQVQQATYRLGLMFVLLPTGSALYALAAVIAIVLRSFKVEVYQRFMDGQATDEEVADTVFKLAGTKSLRQDEDGVVIEEHIILLMLSTTPEYRDRNRDFPEADSPLLRRYREIQKSKTEEEGYLDADWTHASDLLRSLEYFWNGERIVNHYREFADFRRTMERLELLSPDLQDGGESDA